MDQRVQTESSIAKEYEMKILVKLQLKGTFYQSVGFSKKNEIHAKHINKVQPRLKPLRRRKQLPRRGKRIARTASWLSGTRGGARRRGGRRTPSTRLPSPAGTSACPGTAAKSLGLVVVHCKTRVDINSLPGGRGLCTVMGSDDLGEVELRGWSFTHETSLMEIQWIVFRNLA